MKKWIFLIIDMLLLFLFPVVLFFTQNEIILALFILVITGISLSLTYHKREWLVFLVGVAIGLIFELGGDLIYKMQFWSTGSFFGIPIWLPLLWGYGFIVIRRIGNVIVRK